MRYDKKEKTSQQKRETAGPYSSIRQGGIFPTSVAARKSITALSHFFIENSSEICTCRHLPALHPVAFPTSFQSLLCWSFHRLQWRKWCCRVRAVPPPALSGFHRRESKSRRCQDSDGSLRRKYGKRSGFRPAFAAYFLLRRYTFMLSFMA